MSDDLVRRAAALVEKQKAWDKWDNPRQPAPPAMVEGEVATLVSDMAAEIARLRAERDEVRGYLSRLLQSLHPAIDLLPNVLGVCTQIDHVLGGQRDEITRLRAALATARREGMEEAAKRLEELHRNHGYNPQTGEVWRLGKIETCPLTIDHAIGYYRAISEGVAHILYAAKEGKP